MALPQTVRCDSLNPKNPKGVIGVGVARFNGVARQ